MNLLKRMIAPIVCEVLREELTNMNKGVETQPTNWAEVCREPYYERPSAASFAMDDRSEEIQKSTQPTSCNIHINVSETTIQAKSKSELSAKLNQFADGLTNDGQEHTLIIVCMKTPAATIPARE